MHTHSLPHSQIGKGLKKEEKEGGKKETEDQRNKEREEDRDGGWGPKRQRMTERRKKMKKR